MQSRFFLGLALIGFVCSSGFSTRALASQKRAPALQVYSATEASPEELPADGEVVSLPPTPVVAAPVHAVAPAADRAAYDPVPSDQIDSLANRLKLTLEILLKSHRAYDYRVNTTRDLQAILATVDSKDSKSPATPVSTGK